MITLVDINNFNNTLEFHGLSTDTKPVDIYKKGVNDINITNASTFFEMDKSEMYEFDEENKRWLKI